MNEDYESPQLTKIGSLHELTLQSKEFGSSDGFDINNIPIRNVSA